MTENKKKKYRWVVSYEGRPFYYQGELISEDNDFYVVNDYKEGIIEISKSKLLTRRPMEDE